MKSWITLAALFYVTLHSISGQGNCVGDLNQDLVVNVQDLLLLFNHFGDSCTVYSDTAIQISEIHYNPNSEQGNDSDWEFIELYNSGDEEIELTHWYFSSGITCTFDEEAKIPSHGFFVISPNADSLITQLPLAVYYCEWDFGQDLNNNGETLILNRPNGSIADAVTFEDNDGWVTPPDGMGPSLEWMDPNLPNEAESSWASSFVFGGTPGAANSMWGGSDPE